MSNRIVRVEIRDRSVIPAEAEVLLTVAPERLDGGTDLRGRLMGPRCQFATTIEVAYHFRPLLVPTGRPLITLRAIIPEASLWEPETPHLYTGPLELWQDGQRCEVVQLRHGMRSLSIGPRGLRINGRLHRLRGKAVEALDEAAALRLREAGYNLLVAPATAAGVWDLADRYGFLVLGRLQGDAPPQPLAGHPSFLGWLAAEESGPEVPAAGFQTVPASRFDDQPPGRPLLVVDAAPGEAERILKSDRVLVGVVER